MTLTTSRLALSAALALGILAVPLVAVAQSPPRVPRIGTLAFGTSPDPHIQAFRQQLHDLGYVERQTVAIEDRYAEGKPERVADLAAELVRLKVDVIFALGTDVAVAAKNATTSIPVVFVASGDSVGAGLVSNLARPGGNVTGITLLASELGGK